MTLISELLRQKECELEIETNKVTVLLTDCGREKVQPPKDYWHNKIKLENQVKALKLLLETTDGSS